MNSYLAITQHSKNNWWRYIFSLIFIIGSWFIIGSLPIGFMAAFVEMDGNPATTLTAEGFSGVSQFINFFLLLISFVPFFLATLIAMPLFHGRSPRTLITPRSKISWPRFFMGFGVWFILCALFSLVEALLYPGRYMLTFNPAQLLPIAVTALIFIPIQTSAEELFFRGYLIQGAGLLIKSPIVLSLISGILFMLPHFSNPEMSASVWLVPLFYLSFGGFAAWITLKDQRLELALGLHAANNLFAAICANYIKSALPTTAIFTVNHLDPVYNLIAPMVGFVIFYIIIFKFFTPQEPV